MAALGTGVYITLKLRMCFFGGFSTKPLQLTGSWPGLVLLGELQEIIQTNSSRRNLPTLMRQSRAGWRLLVFKFEGCPLCKKQD